MQRQGRPREAGRLIDEGQRDPPASWKEAAPWTFRVPQPPEWLSRAACTEHPPEWWDAGAHGEGKGFRARQAIRICHACPVRRECLEACYAPIPKPYVLTGNLGKELGVTRLDVATSDDSSEFGIWAGTTPTQRRAVRHLPLELRIEVLHGQVDAERTGAPPRRRLLAAQEIIARWRELGRPEEVPARRFARLVRQHGQSAVFRARLQLGVSAAPERHPESGQTAAWVWFFPVADL